MGEIRNFKSGKDGPPSSAMPRRLAAIIAGDIAGYSRLMEQDEEGTHSRVKRIERDLIEPTIGEHHGRLVKTTGDGFIAIFDSPVEAVRCAIVIQQNLIGRNASVPKHSWIEYRIGVNLGDVIIEADDVYGDGVNVASRLEGIAAPGEVYISGGIYEQIKHKVVCGYESLGDRRVKNITDPVRVYRVLPDATAFNRTRKRRENVLIFLLSLCLLIIAGAVLWYLLAQSHSRLGEQASAPNEISAAEPKPQAAPPEQNVATQAAPPANVAPAPAPVAVPAPTPPPPAVKEPETVMLPGGSFAMGSNGDGSERPLHQVSVKSFAIGKYPVTVGEWNECAAAKACPFVAPGKDNLPITNVSWSDAQQYVSWLSTVTRKSYRLPTEAEWEYAARGGTQSKYWWGDKLQPGVANCKDCLDAPAAASDQPAEVGSSRPNPFGLFDMGGTVDQWVEDCWHRNYQGAPADGSAWMGGDCLSHVLRSGSWKNDSSYVRPANRDNYDTNVRYPTHGFRVALTPS
ncbi:MAG TPA: SUMF1/EgtB/PvdO family nonheme iron enzyme [Bradyrhizobium sp.]|nr:SUMF1/EgtB/PvdO family nonheme iron enzyme [Bradyrhizobium sp.]